MKATHSSRSAPSCQRVALLCGRQYFDGTPKKRQTQQRTRKRKRGTVVPGRRICGRFFFLHFFFGFDRPVGALRHATGFRRNPVQHGRNDTKKKVEKKRHVVGFNGLRRMRGSGGSTSSRNSFFFF